MVKRYSNVAAMVALVLIFGTAGLAKLIDPGSFRELFAHFGLPAWWIAVTGAVEPLGAALVASFFNRTGRRLGAAILAATMAAATILHLVHDPVARALPAAALMLLALYVASMPLHRRATQGPAAA